MNAGLKAVAVVFAALLAISGLLTMLGAVDTWMIVLAALELAAAAAILVWVRRSGNTDPA